MKIQFAACMLVALVVSLASLLLAQAKPDSLRRPDSPVFKDYRPKTPTPVIEQSDATYQLWQGFRVQQEANAGNAVSQFELSIRYLTGRGFKSDTVKAAYWTTKAAQQNHLLARYNLGIFQFNGWGTEWNPFEAYRNFRFAAERGIPEAQFALAQFLLENLVVPQNWNEAYRWTKQAADSGYAPARDAMVFFQQRGFQPSSSTAASQARTDQSVSQQPVSQLQPLFLDFNADTTRTAPDSILFDELAKSLPGSLADSAPKLVHSTVVGGSPFHSADLVLVRRAADSGSPEALIVLGRCCEMGFPCTHDRVRAAAFYIRAIRLDSRRAPRLLLRLLDESFFTHLQTRVDRDDPEAQYVWASLTALGYDRRLTDTQALQLLERAAGAHHVPALIELGLAYYAGRWVPRSEEKARELWQHAAILGSDEARVRLAIVTVQRGMANPAVEVADLQRAVQHGSVLAEVGLAYCYQKGIGVPQNKGEAVRLYRSAAQRGSQDAYYALLRLHDEIRPKEREFEILH